MTTHVAADQQEHTPAKSRSWLASQTLRTTRVPHLTTGMAIVAVVIVGLIRMVPAIDSTPFQRDEARWVGNSALLREWRHPLGGKWQDEGYANRYGTLDESNRRRSQPPLAMYVLGFGLLLQGQHLPESGYWIMSHDAEWNIAHGNIPTSGQLRAARYTNVVLALATAVLVVLIGRTVIGVLGGLISGLGYALNPLVLSTSTRAWSDPTLVLCLALAGLAAIWFGQRPSLGRAAVIGIALGFGASAKLSPLLLALLIAPFVAVPLIRSTTNFVRLRSVAKMGAALLVVPLTALATFVALYPYLWTKPIGHTRRMFDFRSLSFDLQRESFPPARVVDNVDALQRIETQLADRFSLGGLIGSFANKHLGVGYPGWIRDLDLVLAAVGAVLLVGVLTRKRFPLAPVMPLAVLGGQSALIMATYRLDYSRYLLPVVPLLTICIGAALAIPVQYAWQFTFRRDRLRRS